MCLLLDSSQFAVLAQWLSANKDAQVVWYVNTQPNLDLAAVQATWNR